MGINTVNQVDKDEEDIWDNWSPDQSI